MERWERGDMRRDGKEERWQREKKRLGENGGEMEGGWETRRDGGVVKPTTSG
jgi:hypothetical protein